MPELTTLDIILLGGFGVVSIALFEIVQILKAIQSDVRALRPPDFT